MKFLFFNLSTEINRAETKCWAGNWEYSFLTRFSFCGFKHYELGQEEMSWCILVP